MIVLDPDKVVVLQIERNRLGEKAVRLRIALPSRLIEGNFAGVIVEKRP